MYQGIIHDLVVGMHNQKKDQSAITPTIYKIGFYVSTYLNLYGNSFSYAKYVYTYIWYDI